MHNTVKTLLRPLVRPIKIALRPILYSRTPPLCDNVVQRCLDWGYPVKRIHDPFLVEFPIPRGSETDPKAAPVFDAHSKIGLPAQFLVCLPEGGVPSSVGFTTMPKGEFLIESVHRPHQLLDSQVYRSHWPLKKRYLEGDWYNLISLFGGNYGHWLWEDLPRLFTALPHLPESTRFLVPDTLKPFQKDSLFALGISADRLVTQPGNIHSKCERLWFATALGNLDWVVTAPDVIRRMAKVLVEAFQRPANRGPELIYVSRSALLLKAQKRLVNEDELLPVIQRLGFTVVRPEGLSLKEQICTFQNARVVLGAFGAGLTNMFFCPPSSMVLELQDPVFAPREWYWKVASALGHDWRCYVGQSEEKRALAWTDWPSVSFSVDEKGLVEFLKCVLENNGRNSNLQWWNRNHPSASIRRY
jgi:capsular polysaccharide biosynthesis protein